ncbi:NADH-flavin reductase [Planobispora rosea]|uniref:NADH-flavin reductase n=1 Tax=Planobispora rosea TaxID=35762 RepID=A0A8J3WGP5_PLARO|nr:NAD(P)H-binding protein [Planobispora rosea]GGT03681.1 NADH-flavin reductase [Planobispora rosea]GIH88760.1 NADH-flavin reductase [Planobispora rosea]
MRLAIFGATGRAGRVVVEHALQRGHEVSALTRDPARIRPHAQLRVVGGDVRDPAAAARTLEGADAIVSTLGGRRRDPDVCAEGIRTVLAAAAGKGPRRLVILSNYGVADSRHRTAYVAVSWLIERAVLRDKEQMEALVRASDTDWTMVRAPVLTDGPRTGRYRTGTELRLSFTARVSRADIAEFMLTELRDNAYLRRAVAITS